MKDKRLLLFLIWLACYGIILAMYFITIDADYMPWKSVFPLMQATSAVILVQLTIMSAFIFGARNAKDFKASYQRRKYAAVAYWLSISYIVIFVGLVFFGITYPTFPTFSTEEANDMILKIMGMLGIVVNGPVTYLFGAKPAEKGKMNGSPSGK